MSGDRIFVTGLGALTASGATADSTWASVKAGVTGIADITQWDISSWSHRLGGELKQFRPAESLPDRKLLKVISRQDAIGINAAMQAVNHSGVLSYRDTLASPDTFNEATAVYVGSPGNKYYQQYDFLSLTAKSQGDMSLFAEHLFQEVHPMWLLRILPNNVLAYVGITCNFKGPNQNVTNHAVSGTQALLEAYHAIKTGQAERAVVVAYDVAIEPQALFYYQQLGVISGRHLKPFDGAHDGTILAEGAAALVLESESSASARGAVCYAELVGGASASEASGLFSMASCGVTPNAVGMVVAHGNGNQKSDKSEACAVSHVFGNYSVPVTAFKWSMGHTVCASGLVDAVLGTYALRDRVIPGIANLEQLSPDCAALNASAETRSMVEFADHVLLINRGYASMNACLLLRSC